jgi:uncharacterized protein
MAKAKFNPRRLPPWLPPVLVLVLVVLGGALWLSARHTPPPMHVHAGSEWSPVAIKPAPKSVPPAHTASGSPVFEDFSRVAPVTAQIASPAAAAHIHGLALILDDVGYDLPALRQALALPYTMAISVLPDTPHASEAAEMAHAAGRVVMLHMPMEPDSVHYQKLMDDSFLRVGMPDSEIRSLMLSALSKVPYVQGVNNHMGSLLTSMADPMAEVMQVCRDKHLFFVDSRTTAASVASTMAARAGIPWASRQIFLDNQTDEASLQRMWNKALACERRYGVCIVIAHPHHQTLDFLAQHTVQPGHVRMLAVTDVLHGATLARNGD